MEQVTVDPEKIRQIFADLDRCDRPGAIVGIALGGSPVFRRGFGIASVEQPVALSTTTRMRIMSETKHFVALAYLLLCEEGKASVDDSIGKYLPEVHLAMHGITMRQLMSNTGGNRDAHDVCWQFSGMTAEVTSEDLLALYRGIDDLEAPAGTIWFYNNGGWLMLGTAIERITGQSLEDVLRDRIFDPVGMYDTLLCRGHADFVPNSAALHLNEPNGSFKKPFLATSLAGEGGMISTVDDMLRWLAHMDAPVIGNADSWKLMKTPQVLPNGTSTGYGFGLFIEKTRGVGTIYHPGGGLGCNAQMLKIPAAGLDVVVMVNQHDVSAVMLADRIVDACIPGLEPIARRSATSCATGVFRSEKTGRVIRLFARKQEQIAVIDGMEFTVEADQSGVLWPAGPFRYMKFGISLQGNAERPASIRLSDFGNIDELARSEPASVPDVDPILGWYRSEATDTEVRISRSEGGVRLLTVGRFGSMNYPLEYLAEGIWQTKPPTGAYCAGVLSFEGSDFGFWSLRTRALMFRRGERRA